jgi:hypothetical protein
MKKKTIITYWFDKRLNTRVEHARDEARVHLIDGYTDHDEQQITLDAAEVEELIVILRDILDHP